MGHPSNGSISNGSVQFKAAQLRGNQRLAIPQTLSLPSETLTVVSCLCSLRVKSIQIGAVAKDLLGTIFTSLYFRHSLPELPVG